MAHKRYQKIFIFQQRNGDPSGIEDVRLRRSRGEGGRGPAHRGDATVGSSSQTLSSPPKEPPPPPPESPAPEPETIETPRVMSRPPGLASPQRELRAAKVVGNVLALDDQSQQHLLRHEELREVRDAAPPVPKIFGLACNTQFSCIADASGRNLEVMVVNANRSKEARQSSAISFAARICSCALKPDDRHLLVACEDATLSTYRLDPSTGNASTVLKLQFSAEDPPKELWGDLALSHGYKWCFTAHLKIKTLLMEFPYLCRSHKAQRINFALCLFASTTHHWARLANSCCANVLSSTALPQSRCTLLARELF
eukprot:s1248_g19.t1